MARHELLGERHPNYSSVFAQVSDELQSVGALVRQRLPALPSRKEIPSVWKLSNSVFDSMTIRNIVRGLLGEPLLGMIDYYRFPERRKAWGGPFNGQASRQALFRALVEQFKPAAIVETGTFMGTTTAFMARDGLPVYSAEINPRAHGFAKARFRGVENVHLQLGDSRQLLGSVLDGPLRSVQAQTLFVYLDAHWNADLPLAEELAIVFSRCPAAIVMVDDFHVPSDAGYAYDDFGPDDALTESYIAPAVAEHSLDVFYPSTPSAEESGARRGCVILAKRDVHGADLASMPLLRRASVQTSSMPAPGTS
ncbi:MAG: hypothetical protein WAM62_09360 [Pseudolabrys sp.]